jgi:hypothetical protein
VKVVAGDAVPLASNGNGNGPHTATNGNGNGHVASAAESPSAAVLLPPHLTAQGFKRLLERENNPCGPGLLATRIRAYVEAEKQDEAKLIAGALEDLAAAAAGYSYRVRLKAGIWAKPIKAK